MTSTIDIPRTARTPMTAGTATQPVTLPRRYRAAAGAHRTDGRVAELERRCLELWAAEPNCSPQQRTAALEVVHAVEHCVAGLVLREEVAGRCVDRRFLPTIEQCERDLDLVEPLWDRHRLERSA